MIQAIGSFGFLPSRSGGILLGFLCKSSGQFCFGDCLDWRSRRSVQLVSFFEVCL